nr:adhesion G protein-coupled receptor F4-like [Pocillopora verrucosa]
MGVYMMEKRFLTFLIMSTVLQILVQDVTSIANWHGRINFRRSRRNTVRATLKVPSTNAPATTLRTTGRVIASSGFTNTQGVSDSYSFSKKKISKSTPSIANDPKGTALKVETPALTEENDNTSATFNTTQWPATAVSVGNAYVSRNNDVNITRPAPSEASNVKISRNDNIANYSGQYKGQSHDKTQSNSSYLTERKYFFQHSDKARIQKIQEFLEDNGCFSASFDKETEEFIFENPSKGSMRHGQALNTLETTLMSISMTAEVVSLALLVVIRVSKSERIFVHKNLLISLAFGQLAYILDINIFASRNLHHTICSVIAAVQHYLYTSLYTWMLIEAINLYLKIVKVFSFGKSYATYSLIGWGIPGLIVVLMAAIQPSTYDMSTILYKDITCGTLKLRGTEERERCWLNGSIWKFKGPVLAMLLANLAIFVIVLRMSFGRIGSTMQLRPFFLSRKGLKAIFALLPLLGVTFLLGFFVDFHVAVEYAFVLLNSIQGVLFFICHCVLDDQIRDAMNKMLRKRKRVHSLQQFKQEPKKAIGMASKKTAGVVKNKTNEGGKSE